MKHYQSHHWALLHKSPNPFSMSLHLGFLGRWNSWAFVCGHMQVYARLLLTSGPLPVSDLTEALLRQVRSSCQSCKTRWPGWRGKCAKKSLALQVDSCYGRDAPLEPAPPYKPKHTYIMLWWSVPRLSQAHRIPNCIQGSSLQSEPEENELWACEDVEVYLVRDLVRAEPARLHPSHGAIENHVAGALVLWELAADIPHLC